MSACRACGGSMRDHATLDLAKCMNPFCAEFDRPRISHRAARLAAERAESPAALPPGPIPGAEGTECLTGG